MGLSNLINLDELDNIINKRVSESLEIKAKELKDELAKNYVFNDYNLTRKDVAKVLAISLRQVDNLKSKGKLKSCLIGKSVRFKNSVVQDYIKNLS